MKKAIIVGLTLVLMLSLITSCGVPREEYEKISSELAVVQAQVQSLQAENVALRSELAAAQAQIQSIEAKLAGQKEVEAAITELTNIQTQVIAMMVDNGISQLPNPVTVPTNDMSAFPDATSICGIDKIFDPDGNAYVAGQDKDGYLLYQHDITADGAQTGLVNYVPIETTMGTYTVDAWGTVYQVTTGYE